ncbi:MAG: hypothetical protein JNL90_10285 [Planctomycetes bacterium]|nr:hypothetical protein [Planctomycetota bacterium]
MDAADHRHDDAAHGHDHPATPLAAGGAHHHAGVTAVPGLADLPERGGLLALLLLLVAATLVSGGFLLHARELHLPACSEPWDAAIYPWNFLWAKEALGAPDGWLLFTRRFYWPEGEGLGLYTPTWVYAVLSLPFQWLLPEPASRHVAVAFLLWLSSAATALLAYRLARDLGLRRAGALLVALLALTASGRLMNAARLNLFCTEFLLLWMVAGLAWWRRGGAARAAGFGAASALLFLQSQPLLFQAALLGGVLLIATAVRRDGRAQLVARARSLLGAVAVALLLTGPFLVELLRELPNSPALSQALEYTPFLSLDVVDLVRPNGADRFAPVLRELLPERPISFFEQGGPLGTVSHFLGLGWLALLVLALAWPRLRAARRALLLALALLALAVGPYLHVGGEPLLPMPWLALQQVPLLAIEKSPTRLIWLVQLAAALAAAFALDRLIGEKGARGRPLRIALGALLAGATLAEQGETVPLRSVEPRLAIPTEIAALARELPPPLDPAGGFAVLDLPYDGVPPHGTTAHGTNAFAMALGAAHERPFFFGLYPRAARLGEAERAKRPLFRALERCRTLPADATLPPLAPGEAEAIRADLADLSIGAVLLHDFAVLPERQVDGRPVPERARLRELLRALQPASETALSLGKDYAITLFRF